MEMTLFKRQKITNAGSWKLKKQENAHMFHICIKEAMEMHRVRLVVSASINISEDVKLLLDPVRNRIPDRMEQWMCKAWQTLLITQQLLQ